MTQSGNNNDDDTTIRRDEWLAEIEKAAPQNGLTDEQVQFLKDCREANLSYDKIVLLWKKYFPELRRSSIRNRWMKIVKDEKL